MKTTKILGVINLVAGVLFILYFTIFGWSILNSSEIKLTAWGISWPVYFFGIGLLLFFTNYNKKLPLFLTLIFPIISVFLLPFFNNPNLDPFDPLSWIGNIMFLFLVAFPIGLVWLINVILLSLDFVKTNNQVSKSSRVGLVLLGLVLIGLLGLLGFVIYTRSKEPNTTETVNQISKNSNSSSSASANKLGAISDLEAHSCDFAKKHSFREFNVLEGDGNVYPGFYLGFVEINGTIERSPQTYGDKSITAVYLRVLLGAAREKGRKVFYDIYFAEAKAGNFAAKTEGQDLLFRLGYLNELGSFDTSAKYQPIIKVLVEEQENIYGFFRLVVPGLAGFGPPPNWTAACEIEHLG